MFNDDFNTLSREGLTKRRYPRLFMSLREEAIAPIQGLLLALPDRTHVPVLGISLAGLMISPQGILSQIRLGQILDCKLKVAGQVDPVLLKLRVLRLNSMAASLIMESISSEHRLKLEQSIKDTLIFNNLRSQSTEGLHPILQKGVWWNGPFDTNFLSWSDPTSGLLRKAVIEYDGVTVLYETSLDGDSVWLQKSVPATEEARGYGGPWLERDTQRISLGHNWKTRLQRLLESTPAAKELSTFTNIVAQL